jgi:hypothetical protein
MNDRRLDELIRSSLGWEAARVAGRQPSLQRASSKLAARVGADVGRRQVVLTPAGAGGFSTLTIILLLLALLAAAVFVGSLLLRTAPTLPRSGPFGHATECLVGLRDGVVFEVGTEFSGVDFTGAAQDENYTLWADGTHLRNPMIGAKSRAARIRQMSYSQRVLTAAGVDALRERIVAAGLTAGCRSLRASVGGRITAHLESGYMEVFWGPNVSSRPLARLLSDEEESKLVSLVDELIDPSTWLSGEMWVQPGVHTVQPRHWLVYIEVRPTGHEAGDTVALRDGGTLEGTDPRYAQVSLPGGHDLLDFGAPIEMPGLNSMQLSKLRCALVTRDEALALAASLDALSLGTDGEGELFSPDLALEITTSIEPSHPEIYDCAAAAATLRRTGAPMPETAQPAGELADVDPCSLIPAGSGSQMLATSGQATWPSRLPLGLPARACVLFDERPTNEDPFSDPYYATAMVTLYPRRVELVTAEQLALDMFGAGSGSDQIAGHPMWSNDCFAARRECQLAVAAWADGRLIGFEFSDQLTWPEGIPVIGGPQRSPVRRVSHEAADAFIHTVLENIAPR